MMRLGVVLCVWALSACAVVGQPVRCKDEEQCSHGYYCDTESFICKECLSCQDLKREPPLTDACIKSVAECGACFKGLVVDRLGDVNSPCVVASPEDSGGLPSYVWWLLGCGGMLLFVGMLCISVYIWKLEIWKFGSNCQSGTVSTNIRTETRPSAPEAPAPPPPYAPPQYNDINYSSVRTESPCLPQHEPENGGPGYVEEEGPFIKRPMPAQPSDARVAAGRQAASVFNPPIYERQDLPSPESPVVTELDDNLVIHDEETMESMWSPSGPSNGDAHPNNASSNAVTASGVSGVSAAGDSLPTLLAAARDTALVEHTPPKQICIRPPSTNRNRDSNPGGDGNQGQFSGCQNGGPYNFITQITNVVQFNRST